MRLTEEGTPLLRDHQESDPVPPWFIWAHSIDAKKIATEARYDGRFLLLFYFPRQPRESYTGATQLDLGSKGLNQEAQA